MNRGKHTLRRRSGMALIMALIVLSLLAITLTALAAETLIENKRMHIAMEDAQLRELLIAGVIASRSNLQSSSTGGPRALIPEALRQQGAALTIQIQPGASSSERWIEIEASLPKHRTSERVHMVQGNSGWEVTDAQLGS